MCESCGESLSHLSFYSWALNPYLLAVAFEILSSSPTVNLHKNELSPFVPFQHQLQENSMSDFIFELQSLLENKGLFSYEIWEMLFTHAHLNN